MVQARGSLIIPFLLGWLFSIGIGLGTGYGPAYGQADLRVRGDRWLALSDVSGYVEIVPRGGQRRLARRGDRLSRVGDVLITGPDSSARLEMDEAIGIVAVAENTRLQVQALSITTTGAYITDLFLNYGQARLRIRPLTNPATRIEIYTPAGVSGVRGTDFGVAVGPKGQTGVATFEGVVSSEAQGQAVTVNAQQQTTIRPGEPPTPPAPLRDDPALFIETLRVLPNQRDAAGRALAQVVGYTDPANLLQMNVQPRLLDREGRFDLTLPVSAGGRIPTRVTTPLGTIQKYELLVP